MNIKYMHIGNSYLYILFLTCTNIYWLVLPASGCVLYSRDK